jgi:hypothetical protein
VNIEANSKTFICIQGGRGPGAGMSGIGGVILYMTWRRCQWCRDQPPLSSTTVTMTHAITSMALLLSW